ncbi:PREDICTED: uncharacterized protein LOC108567746 [Nicrophorus vespilloides]|uniref:Uncharacterized protein LOC108567746 n=1 Tax=Nicrophorus vespilloides TaxID=110193 RepID=A0ABM1NAM5_NICVS|nr:PREDICTED: uncharacterized protein LOC108567746 [Nicrophorus vespilloides]
MQVANGGVVGSGGGGIGGGGGDGVSEPQVDNASLSAPQTEVIPSLSHRIWNLSRLSFDGTDRTNFLYRQDLHRHFVISTDTNFPRGPLSLSSKDCSTCLSHDPAPFSPAEKQQQTHPLG